MIAEWIKEIKEKTKPEELGMILVHNGIVRGTSKDGRIIKSMRLSYDKKKLSQYIDSVKEREGISDIKVWINEGELKIGDDIMVLLVAGRFRTDVLPILQEVLTKIKKEIVTEEEIF
ncbi:MAG TPA: molybdenum cofactor biosynthesis protein MoaE [Syntrophorhabdaceae bacterium]|nr:molybdenum cofactor biosynthesis protein MoaE [Syntrophorhabdaceae bacterium]HPP06864.1 molybdenum cofactor biosynthesis protein MoaE [Syntrophorhabdaceae bacterium]